jgi:long-chain fatty acid transport protein
MALFDSIELSLGFETLITDISAKDVDYRAGGVIPAGSESYDDIGGTSVAPNIHLIVPVNDKFAWGVNLYSNFGTKTEFDNNLSWSEYGGLTDVASINLGLAGSYRLNEQWSFGAGLDLIYGTGELKRTAGAAFGPGAGTTLLDADASGFGVGFNIGTVYELNDNNRFGLSYRYSPEIEAEGDIEYAGNKDSNGKLHLPLPDMAEFSGYHRLEDTKFAVHYSVQWIGWSAFDKLDATINGSPETLNVYDWQDGWHYALGGTYYMNSDWTLRAGYMYDTSAQNKTTSVSVPDSDRQWLSAGFTYHIDTKSNIDFGFTYLIGKDVDVNESTEVEMAPGVVVPVSTISATTRADAILVGLQYSRSF